MRLNQLRIRRGISLIEVSAAMTASMVLMGATLTALVALQQADREQLTRADDQRVVALLVDRLRDDVHAATDFTCNEADGALRMTTSAGEIAYEQAQRRWVRTDSDGLKSAFRLPKKLRLRIEPNAGSAGDLVRIQIYSTHKSPTDEATEAVHAELSAAVGRDGRLLVE